MGSVREAKVVVGMVVMCMVAWYTVVCSDTVRHVLYNLLK